MPDANWEINNVTHTQEPGNVRFNRRVLLLLNSSARELSVLNSAGDATAFDPNGMPPSPFTRDIQAALTCRPQP